MADRHEYSQCSYAGGGGTSTRAVEISGGFYPSVETVTERGAQSRPKPEQTRPDWHAWQPKQQEQVTMTAMVMCWYGTRSTNRSRQEGQGSGDGKHSEAELENAHRTTWISGQNFRCGVLAGTG